MGDWVYYVSILDMKSIADRISIAPEIHPSQTLEDLLQRQLEGRSHQIAMYLRSQPQRFFNALVIGTYGGNPQWNEVAITPRDDNGPFLPNQFEGSLGILSLSGREKLWAIDGQHRVAGIREAVENSGDRLAQEEVSVIFIKGVSSHERSQDPEGFERTRRLFTALNRYAKPISKKDVIALDEDDVGAIITRMLINESDLLHESVSINATRALPPSDETSFTTIEILYDVLNLVLRDRGAKSWREFLMRRPSEDEIDNYARRARDFLDTMLRCFPELRGFSVDGVARTYRHDGGGHLLFRPVGFRTIAHAVRALMESDKSMEDAVGAISKYPMELSESPWSNLLWDAENRRMSATTENQKVASRILYYASGGDPGKYRKSPAQLLREYAGILNRDINEVSVPGIDFNTLT